MTIPTRKVDVKITNPDGSIVFERKQFEIPEEWSNRAATIVASKYAMDNENSAVDIIYRVVNQITDWGIEQGYFNEDDSVLDSSIAAKFSSDLTNILIKQRAAFNSPVWFNCGVKENSNQMSACFIFPVEDKIEDILDHVKREGIVFKSGSGAGVNVSKLRAKGEKLSNKGEASGPISFMRVYDANAGSIKSGGKSRRSAKMVCLDVDHPDIMEFIECKKHEEQKAKALIAAGYSQEEAYSTVAFQNTNHSIRVTDEFMGAVECDGSWSLINRGDGKVAQTLRAKDILRRTAEIAWETGDPGIQFDTAMNKTNPIPVSGRIYSTNPCSEFSAIDNSSCNLASLNLIKYKDKETGSIFDFESFFADIDVLVTAMDIIVDAADYPTPEVRDITTRSRPLGLGFTNLGALLMSWGIPYDSEVAKCTARNIIYEMTLRAYEKSIELAKKLGPFEMFKENKDAVVRVANELLNNRSISDSIEKHGIRNSQLTLLAPTGTISFMMDCDSTGIEPLFALKVYKQLAGGGIIEITPTCICEAADMLASAGYDIGMNIDEGIDKLPEDKKKIFETANDISWKAHIDMMAVCQEHINGAISKTVNMPADCTVDDVFDAYVYAWKQGLKAVAIYRDGSKGMQPLSTKKQEEVKEDKTDIKWRAIRKRLPDDRPAKNHKFDIAGFEGYVNAGYYPEDGQLGEIFVTGSKIGSQMKGLLESFSIVTSMALQYGVPLDAIADKFINSRFDPSGITTNPDIRMCSSIMDYIFKWLKGNFGTEMPEPEVKLNGNISFDGPSCNNCGSITTRQGTCFVCPSCGETSGCS